MKKAIATVIAALGFSLGCNSPGTTSAVTPTPLEAVVQQEHQQEPEQAEPVKPKNNEQASPADLASSLVCVALDYEGERLPVHGLLYERDNQQYIIVSIPSSSSQDDLKFTLLKNITEDEGIPVTDYRSMMDGLVLMKAPKEYSAPAYSFAQEVEAGEKVFSFGNPCYAGTALELSTPAKETVIFPEVIMDNRRYVGISLRDNVQNPYDVLRNFGYFFRIKDGKPELVGLPQYIDPEQGIGYFRQAKDIERYFQE